MELPNDIIKIIFKDRLAHLVCLNKKLNQVFQYLVEPFTKLKPGRIHSFHGLFEVSKGMKKNGYVARDICITTDDDIYALCKKAREWFRPCFYNGVLGPLSTLIYHKKDMIYKDIILKYKYGYNWTITHSTYGVDVDHEYVIIYTDRECYIYESANTLTLKQIHLLKM